MIHRTVNRRHLALKALSAAVAVCAMAVGLALIAGVATSGHVIAEDGWVDIKRDFHAVGDGVTDDTAAVQSAMTYAERNNKPVRVPPGTYLVGPINMGDPATQDKRDSGSGQCPGVTRVKGAGRGFTSIFLAKPGAYKENQFVLTRRNTCGVHYSDFCVSGNKSAYGGMDLSFEQTPAGDPSNMNILENVWVEDCTKIGVNLDRFYDSKISGLVVRRIGGFDARPISVTFRGPGGLLVMSDCYFGLGVAMLECQNGGFERCGFYNGIELTGGSYNHIDFTACHFYPNPETKLSINSTAIGSATRSVRFGSCYFNNVPGITKSHVAGRFHIGAVFENCLFWKSDSFFGSIDPGDGPQRPPFFVFRNCSIEDNTVSATPATKARVKMENCRLPSTGIFELRKNY